MLEVKEKELGSIEFKTRVGDLQSKSLEDLFSLLWRIRSFLTFGKTRTPKVLKHLAIVHSELQILIETKLREISVKETLESLLDGGNNGFYS